MIEKRPGANTLEVTRGVEAALDELRPGLAGIDIDTSVSRAGDVRRRRDLEPRVGAAGRRGAPDRRAGGARCTAGARSDRGRRDRALAGGRAARARPARRDREPDDRRRPRDRARRCSSTTPSPARDDRRACAPTARRRATRPRRSCSRRREARRGIVYATLIALLPLLPYLFSEGVDQAVAEPLVISLPAGGAGVAGRLGDGHAGARPAPAPLTHGESGDGGGSPLLRPAAGRATRRSLERVVRAPRPAFGARPRCSCSRSPLAPLLHPVDAAVVPRPQPRRALERGAGDVRAGDGRLTARVGNELRSIPGVDPRRRAPGPGGARRPGRRRELGRALGDRRRASADYGATVDAVKDAVAGYPGVSGERQHLPRRPGEALRHRHGKDITVRVVRPGVRHAARDGRPRARHALAGRRRRPTCRSRSRPSSRTSRSRSTWPRPSSTASSPATCAAPRRRCWPASRSAACSSSRRCSRSSCGARRTARSSLTSIKNLLIDTPDRRARAARGRGRRPHQPDADRDRARRGVAADRHRPERERARPGRRRGRHRPQAGRDADAARVPRRGDRLLPDAPRRSTGACWRRASRPRSSASSCCCRPRSRAGGWRRSSP